MIIFSHAENDCLSLG